MPTAPPRPCLTCGRLHCQDHRRVAWAKTLNATATKRLSGSRGNKRKTALFAVEPWCRLCRAKGDWIIATTRDHIIPLAKGGAEDTAENEQPLCKPCHDAKTAGESRRGRRK